MPKREVIEGDCRDVLRTLPEKSVQCCVTSPPYYGLRDYGIEEQTGIENSPNEYVATLVTIFQHVRRVLRDGGTVWLNLGDNYSAGNGTKTNGPQTNKTTIDGVPVRMARGATPSDGRATLSRTFTGMPKPKDLLGIPWRVAFALQADGWYLRSAIVWHKPNGMPESCTDRPSSIYEMVFLLTKYDQYFYDAEAIYESASSNLPIVDKLARSRHRIEATAPGREGKDAYGSIGEVAPGKRNARNVWSINTKPFYGPHFATMPVELAKRCIKAGSRPGDTILDPFGGAGTTAVAAEKLGRNSITIELNPDNVQLIKERLGLVIPKDFFKQP